MLRVTNDVLRAARERARSEDREVPTENAILRGSVERIQNAERGGALTASKHTLDASRHVAYTWLGEVLPFLVVCAARLAPVSIQATRPAICFHNMNY